MKSKRILLFMPPFWDPLCPPMGMASLKSYLEQRGHQVTIYDFNTDPKVFPLQYKYFEMGAKQLPQWKNWNIRRNGCDCLSQHQTLYLTARNHPDYPDMVREIMDLNMSKKMSHLDIRPFEGLFETLFGLVKKKVKELMEKVQPDVVGCTLLNSTASCSNFILEHVKELKPDTTTVLGGPGPILGITADSRDLLTFFENRESIDFIAIGEGEPLIEAIVEGEFEPRRILSTKDLAETSKVNSAGFAEMFPCPDFHGLDTSRYLMLSVSSSRGCPYECSFCAETVFWKGFRTVNADELANRLERLANEHKSSTFYLCDSLSNHIISPLTARLKERNANIKIDCYLRADEPVSNKKNLVDWREGGLFRARLGLESASPKILDAMVKMTTPDKMSAAVKGLAETNIHTSTLWMVGFPGETEVDFQMTLDFIKDHHKYIYQADPILFLYHPEGLSRSESLAKDFGTQYRYSKSLQEVLKINSYVLENETSLPEKFDRMERINALQKELDIPNPYTVHELMYADRRWEKLGYKNLWRPSYRTR